MFARITRLEEQRTAKTCFLVICQFSPRRTDKAAEQARILPLDAAFVHWCQMVLLTAQVKFALYGNRELQEFLTFEVAIGSQRTLESIPPSFDCHTLVPENNRHRQVADGAATII